MPRSHIKARHSDIRVYNSSMHNRSGRKAQECPESREPSSCLQTQQPPLRHHITNMVERQGMTPGGCPLTLHKSHATCISTHIFTHIHTCTHTPHAHTTQTHSHTCMHTRRTHIHTYISHTHAHTHHTHTHTHITHTHTSYVHHHAKDKVRMV